ncbi:Protein CutA like protein [Pteropus alecto]|uniref:Protein CutA like protein n=2 Tax=Pteropus TaxID=9401 RepID=L5KBP4_PTEAL|nr:Protein CutA like protein [Pteropus alecto]
MDRLGSRCPLPGYLRPSVLICLLMPIACWMICIIVPMQLALVSPMRGKEEEEEEEEILAASFLTYPMLRTLSLQLRSAVTGSYVSGTYSIVFVNCPNEQIARDIARAILDKKLAASVNILPKASSLYFWNGEIEEATEILLLIKTKTSKVHVLSSYIRLVHPFEIPEVFSVPMDQGDVHYLKWLEEGMKED